MENFVMLESVDKNRIIKETRKRQKDPSEKGNRGRPLKYEYVEDEEGNILGKIEIDYKRYWFVSFVFIQHGLNRFGSKAFVTDKGQAWSSKDVENIVGITPIQILSWSEFKNAEDYKKFINAPKEEPVMGLMKTQILTGEY